MLFIARAGFDPFTIYRLDLYGDGTCSDEIAAAHAAGQEWTCDASGDCAAGVTGGYEVNGACVAGVPQGFMFNMMLGDLLFLSLRRGSHVSPRRPRPLGMARARAS